VNVGEIGLDKLTTGSHVIGGEHDWSSHAADAFGLMAVAYKEPSRSARFNRQLDWQPLGIV
jgi:phage terminase large subunit